MKRLFVSIVALVMMAASVFAQSKDVISVSTSDNIPLLLGSVIGGGVIGSLTDAPAGMKMGDVSDRGCFTLGYTHYLNSKVSVGGELSYAGAKINFENEKTHKVESTTSADIFMLMATGKCDYFHKGIFTMGGDLSLGAMTDFDGSTSMAFQIDPVDLRLGGERAGGFLRLGFGVRGFFTLGFDVRF